MTSSQSHSKFIAKENIFPIIFVFFICLSYWIYLAFHTQMFIIHDAMAYENFGRMISQKGWVDYFQSGPNREPIYPFLVSLSMRLAEAFDISYQSVQKFIQIGILLVTQLFMLIVLRKLKMTLPLIVLTLLYFGLSPAILNSSLSLFSEIATYPIILSIIVLSAHSWNSLLSLSQTQRNFGKFFQLAFGLGLLLVLITLIKGIFELITFIFIFPYFVLLIKATQQRERNLSLNLLCFLLVFFVTFLVPINFYKSLNKKYNGSFCLTDRGPWALYGNTTRRMQPLSPQGVLTALTYVPGEGLCAALFGQKSCDFWSYKQSDGYSFAKSAELRKGNLSNEQVDRIFIRISFQEILKNPLQYILLMGLESLKMFFWESTKIGFVVYPHWLSKIYHFTPFKNGLRLCLAILTVFSLIYTSRWVWSLRRCPSHESQDRESHALLFWTLWLIIPFIGMHSFFYVLPRYIFPIVPLYLILISFSLQQIISSRTH